MDTNAQIIERLQTALRNQEISQTISSLESIIAEFPSSPLPHLTLAKVALAIQDVQLALDTLTSASKKLPNDIEILCTLADICARISRLEEAKQLYARILDMEPGVFEARWGIIEITEREGKKEDALRHCNTGIRFHPENGQLVGRTARLFLELGILDSGIQILNKARKLNAETEDFKAASELAVRLMPQRADAQINLAYAWMHKRDYEASKRHCVTAMELDPEWDEPYFLLASLVYLEGKLEETTQLQIKCVQARQKKCAKLHLDSLNLRLLGELWAGPVGHIGLIDIYLKMDRMGWLPKAVTMIYPPDWCANKAYLSCFEPHYHVITDPEERRIYAPLLEHLEQMISVIPLANSTYLPIYDAMGLAQKEWEAQGGKLTLTLLPEIEEQGWRRFEEWGIPRGSWFVAMHVRDTGWENGAWKASQRAARCAHIESYSESMKRITGMGGWVIRMGDPVMKHFEPMERVIDYAHREDRVDWMDVFLWAKCRFFLASCSGPSGIPPTFGIPVINTNWSTIHHFPPPGTDIFLPKLLWCKRRERLLTFRERTEHKNLMNLESLDMIDECGMILVDNSPDEILDAVIEMEERCAGALQYTSEDEMLQKRFRKIVGADDRSGCARIGRAFIRKYVHLMEE